MSLHSFILGFVLGCTVFCVLGFAGVWRLVVCLDCAAESSSEYPVYLPVRPYDLYRSFPQPRGSPRNGNINTTIDPRESVVNVSPRDYRNGSVNATSTPSGPSTGSPPNAWSVGCPTRPLHLAVLILSSPRGVMRRTAIRGTWLHNYRTFRLQVTSMFLVGTEGMNKDKIGNLTQEDKLFHDMLLLPGLVDTYANLSTKVLMGLQWAHRNIDFDFLVKTDDDSFVRLEELEAVLRRLECDQRLYWGYFMGHAVPETSGKWAEKRWFNCPHYLPYAMGGGYVLSRRVVDLLMLYPERLRCYSNEDVTIGSWLAPFHLVRKHDLRFNVESLSHGCSNNYLISHKERVRTFYDKYTSLVKNHTLCLEEKEVRPAYVYNWEVSPLRCCSRTKALQIPSLDDT